jgi:hypothetical protein
MSGGPGRLCGTIGLGGGARFVIVLLRDGDAMTGGLARPWTNEAACIHPARI